MKYFIFVCAIVLAVFQFSLIEANKETDGSFIDREVVPRLFFQPCHQLAQWLNIADMKCNFICKLADSSKTGRCGKEKNDKNEEVGDVKCICEANA